MGSVETSSCTDQGVGLSGFKASFLGVLGFRLRGVGLGIGFGLDRLRLLGKGAGFRL